MVPYRGRFAVRLARLILAVVCAAWYFNANGWVLGPAIPLAMYALFAVASLVEMAYDTPPRAAIAAVLDGGFFLLWARLTPESWPAPISAAFLLASVSLTQDWLRAIVACGVAIFVAAVVPVSGAVSLAISVTGMSLVAVTVALYRRYLEGRMSMTQRHNVIIRSQAQVAREAERQRIAADFHDGPLQSFVGFQMRLEIIRRLMEKRPEQALDELHQLQELCKTQVTDLRAFVRSMRPADEGMSLAASLARMSEALQRDANVQTSFTSEELHDPPEIEVSLEILQIVREAFNNIQKHSGATEVKVSARRRGRFVEISIEDNGNGFPFAGSFTLEELEAARLGPISIKRRIRMLTGELSIESRPAQGAKLTFRVPF